MSISETPFGRTVAACALIIFAACIASGVIFLSLTLGMLSPGTNTSWVRYFATTQTIWRVPIEFYIAVIAAMLLIARRSIHWSMLLCTILLAINLGMIRRNTFDILLWVTILTSLIGLYILNESFTGTLKTFGRGFINDIRLIQQKSALVWKLTTVILAGAFVINYLHGAIIRQASEEAMDERLLKHYKTTRASSTGPGGIRLKIFTDYQCPACSQLAPKYLETVAAAGGGTIFVELRDYPLDSTCNDSNPSSGTLPHPAACSAAYAVRLVDREAPNKVKDFRAWLYANRTELDDDIILQKLNEIGVNNKEDMFNPEIKHAVRTDVLAAKNYGISGVPSVVLNGVLLPPGLNPSKLEMLLKFEMRGINGDTQ